MPPRPGSTPKRRSSVGSIRASARGGRHPDGVGRGGRPAAPPLPEIVATTLFVVGSTRITPLGPAAQIEPKAATTPVACSQRPAGDDAVAGGIDALELALAVCGRPGCAGGEGGVVGRAADRDRLQTLAGCDGDAADRRRARVLHPHRASAVGEPAGAEADARLADDLVGLRIDPHQIGRPVLADPHEATAGSGCAGRSGDGDRDLRNNTGGRRQSTSRRRRERRGCAPAEDTPNTEEILRSRINRSLTPARRQRRERSTRPASPPRRRSRPVTALIRWSAPHPRRHSRSPRAVSSKRNDRPSSGFGTPPNVTPALEPADHVRGSCQRHAELPRKLGEPHRSASPDQAQYGVTIRLDAVRCELAFDHLRHSLVCGDEQQEEREPPLRRSGGSALRAGRAGVGRCRRHRCSKRHCPRPGASSPGRRAAERPGATVSAVRPCGQRRSERARARRCFPSTLAISP